MPGPPIEYFVRSQRRWVSLSFAAHIGVMIAVLGSSAPSRRPPELKTTKIDLITPSWEPPKTARGAPQPRRPSIVAAPEPSHPARRLAPEQVEMGAPTFEIVDDRELMEAVLSRFQGVIAFSDKADYGFYTSRFRAPDWHAEPISGGIESAGLYCSFDVPGFPLPLRLCREKSVSCDSNAYAGFPKAQCALINQDIKRFAGERGIAKIRSVRVRFSDSTDSGFEVIGVTGPGPP